MITPDQKDQNIVEEKSVPDAQTRVEIPEDKRGTVTSDLQREIYSNAQGTVVRETVSNAIDSHRQAGADRPVEVIIRESDFFDSGTHQLVVKDFGLGMSQEFVMGEFFKMRVSTKNDRNKTEKTGEDLIGGWGIGAQSPYGYVDTWVLESYYEGTKTTYLAQKDPQGGWASPVEKEDTDRTNGVTVRVPIQEGDLATFHREIVKQLRFLLGEIELKVDGLSIELPDVVAETEHFTFYDGPVKYDSDQFTARYGSHTEEKAFSDPQVVMGGIPYDLDTSEVPDMAGFYTGKPFALHVGSGDLELNLSREEVNYNEHSLEALTGHKSELETKAKSDVGDLLGNPDSSLHKHAILLGLSRKSIHGYSFEDEEKLSRASSFMKSVKSLYSVDFDSERSGLSRIRKTWKIRSSGSSHQTSSDAKRKVRKKLLSALHAGSSPDVYYIRQGEKGVKTIYNRYLADKCGTAYVVDLVCFSDEELREDIKSRFESYHDLEFDRSKYRSGKKRGDDEIPAYKPSLDQGYKSKDWRPNDERISQIRANPERYVWGHKSQLSELVTARLACRAGRNVGGPDWTAIRVSKSNGRKLPEERKVENVRGRIEKVADRLLPYRKLAADMPLRNLRRLKKHASEIGGARHLKELQKALSAMADVSGGASDVRRFLKRVGRDASAEDASYPSGVGRLIGRAKRWNEKLSPLGRRIRNSDVAYFLKPRLKSVKAPDLTPIAEDEYAGFSEADTQEEYL